MKYFIVFALVLVACKKDDKPPPSPTATPSATPTPEKSTPSAPVTKDVVITPKGDKFEAGDGRFTILLPDKPKADVDTSDGRTTTLEGGTGLNIYTFSVIESEGIEGKASELPTFIGGIFQGLEATAGPQRPWRGDGLRFEGTAKDGDGTYDVIGWTVAQPSTKRIYVLLYQLSEPGLTKADAEAVANTLKLL